MSPPAESVMPIFYEDDIRHRDGGAVGKKLSYEHDIKGNTLGTPSFSRLEKSSSFKRKSKPAGLEGLMAKELDINNKKLSSGTRPDSRNNNNSTGNNNNNDTKPIEYNIILLGDFGVGKTGMFTAKFSCVCYFELRAWKPKKNGGSNYVGKSLLKGRLLKKLKISLHP